MAESYIDLAIRRQAILERIKSGQVKDFSKIVTDTEKLLRSTFANLENEVSEMQRSKFEALLRDIQNDQAQIFATATKTFLETQAKIAVVTMTQELLDLKSTIDLTDTVLKDFTKKEIFSKVLARPLQTGTGKADLLESWIKDFSDTQIKKTSQAIRFGRSQGKTNQELVKQMVGSKKAGYTDGILNSSDGIVTKKMRRDASTVVRTSTQHVASAARQETWEANPEVVKRYRFLATLDATTSPICRSLDGQEFDFGKGAIPPVHPNCLLPGTLITSACGITGVFKRAYKGKAIRIKTRSGNELSVTPNHPILTNNGWLAAQFLNIGDKCFVNINAKGVITTKGENNAIFASVEQITEAFGGSFQVSSVPVPTATPDFHNDPTDGEIADIFIDGDLPNILYAPNVKHGCKSVFMLGRADSSVFGFGNGSGFKLCLRNLSTSNSVMRFFYKSRLLRFAGRIHTSFLLAAPPSQFNPNIHKGSLYGTWRDIEYFGNSSDPDSFGVFLDDIVSVEVFEFSGHVFNLETDNHLIESNGIVTHNCRSSTIPVLADKYKFLSKGRTRSSAGGYVDANTNYYDWLNNQDAKTQKEVLGEKRAKLFADGGLTPQRFKELQFDKNFEPMTLEQMRKIVPEAFEKAGI